MNIEPYYFLILFPLAFAGIWCMVCMILSAFGGWHSLSRQYHSSVPALGKTYRMQSAQFGFVNYRRCLSVSASKQGLAISVLPIFRVGHPPLFFPWSAISSPKVKKILWSERVEFHVGDVKITFPKRLFMDASQIAE